jgi:hypothetical protein
MRMRTVDGFIGSGQKVMSNEGRHHLIHGLLSVDMNKETR